MTINLGDQTQSGEGRCVLTDRDGNQVFATWECSGVYLQGCRGKFRLTSGTGRFAGIAGQSDFMARIALGELTTERGGESARQTGIGLAVWPALHYTLP